MKIRFLLFVFCLILMPRIISAQTAQSIDDISPEHPVGCAEAAERADYYFQYRKFHSAKRAESELKKALAECAESAEKAQLQDQLTSVQEELANTNLNFALYYLNAYRTEGRGLKGGCSRLRQIAKNYPQFSKAEEVLRLLGPGSECENLRWAQGKIERDNLK